MSVRSIVGSPRRPRAWLLVFGSLVIGATLLTTGIPVHPTSDSAVTPTVRPSPLPLGNPDFRGLPPVPVPDASSDRAPPGAVRLPGVPNELLTVLVSFQFSNESGVNSFLANLTNPRSSEYHHYLTRPAFDSRFGGSASAYAEATAYFQSFSVAQWTTYPDRLTISFRATIPTLDSMFETQIAEFRLGSNRFVAPVSAPELPGPIAASVVQVTGLGTVLDPTVGIDLGHQQEISPGSDVSRDAEFGYPTPPNLTGTQYEWGSDFQVAADAQSLYQLFGYPTNMSIATMLWEGVYSGTTRSTPYGTLQNGEGVGPYDPSDLFTYYNESLPAGEPHPTVTPVPLGGAAGPGPLASWDSTNAVFENTLDLEMAGSTAPGAHLYNVYSPNATLAALDVEFTTILQPNASLAGLANVSVISNSWGSADHTDAAWDGDLIQAQMRGISVLASTGDSDDDGASPEYQATPDWVYFPATDASDTYGATAVGGTTVTLWWTSLQERSQTTWSISAADASDGGPAGTVGGISTNYSEPSWQASSDANSLIGGVGRGVPDISQIANNTLVTMTVDGVQYLATNASVFDGSFLFAWGTSIASPLEAGLVATIDHSLSATGTPWLGFMDPVLYALADDQYASNGASFGYQYSLPVEVFHDVVTGGNALYSAGSGYDLATGWGSLDTYNLTMFLVTPNPSAVPGAVEVVYNRLAFTGLQVTSYYESGGGVNTVENLTVQQNFFLANSLGAPVYWIQNVFDAQYAGQPNHYNIGFAGWTVYPFYAFHQAAPGYVACAIDAVSDYNGAPTFEQYSGLSPAGNLGAANLTFEIYFASNYYSCTLPVPGAAYIIGASNYSYSWEGTTYTNGPWGQLSNPGWLQPQFDIVGGASLSVGQFQTATGGAVTSEFYPWNGAGYEYVNGSVVTLNNTQTGEEAENLSYAYNSSQDEWSFGYEDGSGAQGISSYLQETPSSYPVEYRESGLPNNTTWYLNDSDGNAYSATGGTNSFTTYLINGTYSWGVQTTDPAYVASPSDGSYVVDGTTVVITIVFSTQPSPLTIQVQGLPTGVTWYVNFTGGPDYSGTGSSYSATLPVGTWNWYANLSSSDYEVAPTDGNLTSTGSLLTLVLTVSVARGTVTFTPSGLPSSVEWYVNTSGPIGSALGSSGIELVLSSGSHEYSIATDNSTWRPSAITGSVDVTTSVQGVTVDFVESQYSVEFTTAWFNGSAPALPAWNVTIAGTPYAAGGAQLSLELPNGTYTWAAFVSGANSIDPSQGTVRLQGSPVTVALTLNSTANPGGGGGGGGGKGSPGNSSPSRKSGFLGLPGSDGVLLVVGLAIVIAIGLSLVILSRRGKAPPPPPGPLPPPGASG